MCLRGGRKAGSYIPTDTSPDPEYIQNEQNELDARMATEVTRILNKVVGG